MREILSTITFNGTFSPQPCEVLRCHIQLTYEEKDQDDTQTSVSSTWFGVRFTMLMPATEHKACMNV